MGPELGSIEKGEDGKVNGAYKVIQHIQVFLKIITPSQNPYGDQKLG